MIAVSDPGRGGSHSAPSISSASLRKGLILTNSTPASAQALQAIAQTVLADPATRDLSVARRDAAEHHDQSALPGDHAPTGRLLHVVSEIAHDVRHQDQCGVVAVVAFRAHEAAGRIQEALELALRMVKATGAGPAIGAGEDRLVAVVPRESGSAPRRPN